MTCRNCIHWQADPIGTTGECRAHPPVVVDALVTIVARAQRMAALADAVMDATRWPVTKQEDGCGEHQGVMPLC